MAKVAFGRRILDPKNPTYQAVQSVLREVPKRYRSCSVQIIMRGTSAEYEDWVAVEVLQDHDPAASACVDWITQQVTRRGFVIVPPRGLGNP
jgi:hypothetical protein